MAANDGPCGLGPIGPGAADNGSWRRLAGAPLLAGVLTVGGCAADEQTTGPAPASGRQPAGAPPNVLLIVVDDMNDWVAPLNDGRRGKPLIPTPNLAALAAQGVLFVNAHTPVPLCVPARASLVTGRYPRNGRTVVDALQGGRDDGRFDATVTLAEHFRNHGYRTIGGGKLYPPIVDVNRHWHEHLPFDRRPEEKLHGAPRNGLALVERDQFDWGPSAVPEEELVDARLAAWAAARLQTLDPATPFFLGVGFHLPHLPWYVPQRWLARVPLDAVSLPTVLEDDMADLPARGQEIAWRAPRQLDVFDYAHSDHRKVVDAGAWRQAVQAYIAANAFIDELLGRVLEALRSSPHFENTIVVVLSDNGWHLGEKQHWRKGTLWEESTRVPLVIRFPPGLPAGAVVRAPVSLVDVYPTLVDLAGLPRPAHALDGVALADLIAGRIERPAVMTTWRYGNAALRDERWRYIRYAPQTAELYDHREDPMEHANLLAEPSGWAEHAERLRRYDAFLDRYHPP